MLKYIPHSNNYSCLEIGCGNGLFISNISSYGLKVTGIDISEECVAVAKKNNPSAAILKKSLFEVKDTYDLVFCFDVLEHIENDYAAITRISELIKKGGFFLCSVPAHKNLYYDVVDKYYGHYRRYEKDEFSNSLKLNKFKIVRFWSFGLKLVSVFANLFFSYRDNVGVEFGAMGDDFSKVKYPRYYQKIIAPIISKGYLLFYLYDLFFLNRDGGNSYLVLCQKE